MLNEEQKKSYIGNQSDLRQKASAVCQLSVLVFASVINDIVL